MQMRDIDTYWLQHTFNHLAALNGDMVEQRAEGSFHFRDGRLHRTHMPAVELGNGDRLWYRNGMRHRLEGPAVERNNGDNEFWALGVKLTPDEHAAFVARQPKHITLLRRFTLKPVGERNAQPF